jgi:hypothetical protein
MIRVEEVFEYKLLLMRNIFVGDIHGCSDELQALLKKVDFQDKDRLNIVWDMINKWPKSLEVLESIYDMRQKCRAILGNHEIKFLENFEAISEISPEKWIFPELAYLLKKKPYLLDYLRELKHFIEEEQFLMLHAWKQESIPPRSLVSTKEYRKSLKQDWYKEYLGRKPIIYGHWSEEGLQVRENTIGIDTWCVDGWSLTAFILETREIIQQKCFQPWGY